MPKETAEDSRGLAEVEREVRDLAGPQLEEKRAVAFRVLEEVRERFRLEEVAVAWTGGKDSTLALALWREVLGRHAETGHLRALSIDTGRKFPEVMAFRDDLARRWGVDVHLARPAVHLGAYPVAEDKVGCCRDLKIEPLRKAVDQMGVKALITGVRRDEHPSRAERPYFEPREKPEHLAVHPLLDWTELDVWTETGGRGLPWCELYDRGYRSLGCMDCTEPPGEGLGERAGRNRDKESLLAALHNLGYF